MTSAEEGQPPSNELEELQDTPSTAIEGSKTFSFALSPKSLAE